jgi:hypothetical protein
MHSWNRSQPDQARRRAGRVGVPLALVVAVGGWLAGPAGTAEAATTGSFIVGYCSAQNWTVPAGVDAAVLDVYGAVGGGFTSPDTVTLGGAGGHVHAALALSPGEVLTIAAGGQGGSTSEESAYPPADPGGPGGCNGGGAGGDVVSDGPYNMYPGAGGGGESAVSVSGASAPVLVAAGGGGASYFGNGGQGGPQTGGLGSVNPVTAGQPATGGSQTAGGQPGTTETAGTDGATAGSAGTGGTGGTGFGVGVGPDGGGGGGAGLYGGGAGALDSGAGGSNYISPSAFGGVSDGGINTGQGSVMVTYGTADFPSFTGTPAGGMTGQAYSCQFDSTAWPAPQYFTTDPAALPPGVTLSAGGTLSGTPTTPGSYTFDVDAANPGGASSQQITMNIETPQVTTQLKGGPVGTKVAVSGSGFQPSASVGIRLGSATGQLLATATASASGAFTAHLTIPAATLGAHALDAVAGGTVAATTTFIVDDHLAVSPAKIAPKATAKATVTGFKARQAVTLRLGSATGRKLAAPTTSTAGSGTATITIPAGTKPGTYKIYASASTATPATTATITVT